MSTYTTPDDIDVVWEDPPLDDALRAILRGEVQPALDEQVEIFDRLAALPGTMYAAHMTMLNTLTSKWYGSNGLMFGFARQHTATLPDGNPLHALTASAHIEGYLDALGRGHVLGRMWRAVRYFKDRKVRAEIDDGSDRLLASAAYAGHPWRLAAHQTYAALFHQVEDERRSAPHLMRAGSRPMRWPWAYFGDPAEEFATARKAAGLA